MVRYLSVREQLRADLHAAMRARDSRRVRALRLLLAAVRQVEVDTGQRNGLSDEQWAIVLGAEAEKRREALRYCDRAQREDLAAVERYELVWIEHYLLPLRTEYVS